MRTFLSMGFVCSCSFISRGCIVCVHLDRPWVFGIRSTNSIAFSSGMTLDSVMRQSPSIANNKMVGLSIKCILRGIMAPVVCCIALSWQQMELNSFRFQISSIPSPFQDISISYRNKSFSKIKKYAWDEHMRLSTNLWKSTQIYESRKGLVEPPG